MLVILKFIIAILLAFLGIILIKPGSQIGEDPSAVGRGILILLIDLAFILSNN